MELRYRRRLPHWRVDEAIYFVTWRVAKDQNLLVPIERDVVVGAIKHFQGRAYDLIAYVVMEDHVQVLVKPLRNYELEDILHSWKSLTANQMHGSIPARAGSGRMSTSTALFTKNFWKSSITSRIILGSGGRTSWTICGCGRWRQK
jgi:REP element-mobilizing transposase RayT